MSAPNAYAVGSSVRSRASIYSSCCSPGTSRVGPRPNFYADVGHHGEVRESSDFMYHLLDHQPGR